MWKYVVHDTITGQPLLTVHPSEGSWRRALGAGEGTHTFQTRDAATALEPAQWRDLLGNPNARTLACVWNEQPLYAGMILNARATTSQMIVQHTEGIRNLFSQRLTFGVTTYGGGNLSVANRSPAGAVRAILNRGVFSWGSEWRLPLDLPDDGAGSFTADWHNYDWLRIEDLLAQVEAIGTTIDFSPYYTADGWLRYRTVIGTPLLPGQTYEFPAGATSPVANLYADWDGAKQLTGCFYMGKGSEADMRFGEAGFVAGPGIPVRDAARSAKDVDDVGRLTQMAMTDLVQHRSPTEQYGFDLVTDGSFDPAGMVPGARIKLGIYDHPVIADGERSLYVVGVSGDMTDQLKPEVRPL